MHGETEEEEQEQDLGIAETYAVLYKIIFLPLMPMTIAFLLTSKIGFSAADSATGFFFRNFLLFIFHTSQFQSLCLIKC